MLYYPLSRVVGFTHTSGTMLPAANAFALVNVFLLADQATYLLEGVKPPPAHFILNDEIVDVFAGPEGIWQLMREEHAIRGGEAADDLAEGVPLAAVSFVDKILKSKGSTEKILVSGSSFGYMPAIKLRGAQAVF